MMTPGSLGACYHTMYPLSLEITLLRRSVKGRSMLISRQFCEHCALRAPLHARSQAEQVPCLSLAFCC